MLSRAIDRVANGIASSRGFAGTESNFDAPLPTPACLRLRSAVQYDVVRVRRQIHYEH